MGGDCWYARFRVDEFLLLFLIRWPVHAVSERSLAYISPAARMSPAPIISTMSPGRHNLMNAVAAAAAGIELGIPFAVVAVALGAYPGTARRFETIADTCGIRIIDDYAHHPTEI